MQKGPLFHWNSGPTDCRKRGNYFSGKEGCVRETQEGFPAPFKSGIFRTFEVLKIPLSLSKKTFSIS